MTFISLPAIAASPAAIGSPALRLIAWAAPAPASGVTCASNRIRILGRFIEPTWIARGSGHSKRRPLGFLPDAQTLAQRGNPQLGARGSCR